MKKILSIFFLFVLSISAVGQNYLKGDIIKKPEPQTLVTDYAKILSPEQVSILEEQLVALDDSTTNQIAIVTVPTLGDRAIEDVAVATFRDWGIGNKTSRNGILLLVAANDHHVRIEVGYGLEGAIPDVVASDIIDNDIVPNFKEENYYNGLQLAIESLSKAAAGEYHVRRERNDNSPGGGSILGGIIIAIIIIFLIARGSGGRGGGMMSRRGSNWLAPLIWSALSSGNRRGGWGGGGWGGGGWGGGGSGGGFGGFGGGSSGGGGASGSW